MSTIVGTENVKAAAVLSLKGALKLEMLGMSRKGPSVYSIVKQQFGFKGSKKAVYEQLQRYVWDHVLRIDVCFVEDDMLGWVAVKRGVEGYWPVKDVLPEGVSPKEMNRDIGATDKEQIEDMKLQSMFGWRVVD